VDDGSTDGTAEAALGAARTAGALPRFTLLRAAAANARVPTTAGLGLQSDQRFRVFWVKVS